MKREVLINCNLIASARVRSNISHLLLTYHISGGLFRIVWVQPPDHKQLLIYVITNGIVTLIK